MKIKKGDTVKVISGVHAGKTGEVIRVLPKDNKVVVKDVNMVKKHTKPRSAADQGGIIEVEAPMHVSKVMYVDPKTGTASRLGYEVKDGKKVRVIKKSGTVIKEKKK